MNVCGVELKGKEAILCVLSEQSGHVVPIKISRSKIAIKSDGDSVAIRNFQDDFYAAIDGLDIQRIIIKERPTKGRFTGGAISFKLEAAIQLLRDKEVYTVSSNQLKRCAPDASASLSIDLSGLNKYQEQAYIVAYYALYGQFN